VELDAGLFLQVADDAEEVAGPRIGARANMQMENPSGTIRFSFSS
jgi:hypothetical protein